MKTLFILLMMISTVALSQSDELQIRSVLEEQQECWNAGDIECFMQGYWNSDKLVFIGKNGLTYGWEKVLSNYQQNYPDRAAMGQLAFEIKILEPLGHDHWFMVGGWNLAREEAEDLGGHFSLIWRRLGDEWVIVSDHSS